MPPEPVFDRIVDLASRLCSAPMACLALIDGERTWLKASVGLDTDEMTRTWAFCDHALDSPQTLVVADTHSDDRFRSNALFSGEGGVRAYVGVPLVLDDGFTVGALCVLDDRSRAFGAVQISDLRTLADQIVAELGVRRSLVDLSTRSVVAAAEQVAG